MKQDGVRLNRIRGAESIPRWSCVGAVPNPSCLHARSVHRASPGVLLRACYWRSPPCACFARTPGTRPPVVPSIPNVLPRRLHGVPSVVPRRLRSLLPRGRSLPTGLPVRGSVLPRLGHPRRARTPWKSLTNAASSRAGPRLSRAGPRLQRAHTTSCSSLAASARGHTTIASSCSLRPGTHPFREFRGTHHQLPGSCRGHSTSWRGIFRGRSTDSR